MISLILLIICHILRQLNRMEQNFVTLAKFLRLRPFEIFSPAKIFTPTPGHRPGAHF